MSSVYDVSNLVSIGISTKNRWQDLRITLDKIKEFGLGNLPISVADDHSDELCPFDITSLKLKHFQYERAAESKGYIVRRNEMARRMHTKYYLSLDDDSYPIAGSIQKVVEYAESCPDLFCLSFPIFNPALAEYQNSSISNKPYKVRFFVGCGHLLNIERFLQLGGYREELIHQGEEMEIAARAFQEGWHCYHFPGFEIHHNTSLAGRHWHRMDYYGSRNLVLWNDWFVPSKLKPFKQGRMFASRIAQMLKFKRLGMIEGAIAGIKDIPRYRINRKIMPMEVYQKWIKLPNS